MPSCLNAFTGPCPIDLTPRPAGGTPWITPISETGFVHSVESAGMLDGPGVRFVLFLSGCPLRCLYCHNPDALRISMGKCREATELLNEIERQRPFLRRGGVTLSGGEPILQAGFAKRLLLGCKEMGLHTAVDTTGYLGERVDESMLNATDLWLLDIKSFLPETYRRVTGVELQPTLDFARRVAERGGRMWIRFVLVPGLTDEPANISGVAAFAAGLGPAVERVEVLPFHKLGEYKWRALGKQYALTETLPPSPEAIEAARARFRAHGLRVH